MLKHFQLIIKFYYFYKIYHPFPISMLVYNLYFSNSSETGEKKRPVIIHRAVLGSVERMMAILSESYAGKWPFWLSPRQACVVPVGPAFDDYAVKVGLLIILIE